MQDEGRRRLDLRRRAARDVAVGCPPGLEGLRRVELPSTAVAGCALSNEALGAVDREKLRSATAAEVPETRGPEQPQRRGPPQKSGPASGVVAPVGADGRARQRGLLLRRHKAACRLPAPPDEKGRYVLELFGGSGRFSRAVADLGYKTREYDMSRGPHEDLTRKPVQQRIRRDIKRGAVIAALLAPPCSSFSTARHRTEVARTAAHPRGLADISARSIEAVARGNATMRAAINRINALNRACVLWVLEQPAGSLAWHIPELRSAAQAAGEVIVETDLYGWGTRWRKRTRLAFGWVDPGVATSVARRCHRQGGHCPFTGKAHVRLSGRSPRGIPWTAVAQPYPTRLCVSLARAFLAEDHARRTLNGDFWRHPP